MSKRVFIDGKDIYLRGLELEDIEGGYIHWFDDEEVCRGNAHHRFPYSKEELISYIKAVRDNSSKLVLAVVEKNQNKHIGNISLQSIDYINRRAEFAIVMGEREFWGKGYSKRAGELIISHGFSNLNLHSIYCGTFADNLGMIGLAKTLGFKQEGSRREAVFKNNKYIDIIEFGLLKSDWMSRVH